MKTNKGKIIGIILLCLTMISMIIIQCYAVQENADEIFALVPADLGNKQNYGTSGTLSENTILKKYLKIPKEATAKSYSLRGQVLDNNNNNNTILAGTIYVTETTIRIELSNYNGYIGTLTTFTRTINRNNKDIYIPIYSINFRTYLVTSTGSPLELYYSTETNYNILANEYYQLGYENGYEQGLTDYPNIREDMNIVEHITMLISRFTGNEIAPYITPIAVVLTILMVYFLFIRFLLSLIKAKGVIKVCDITMLVGCIIILVCMYLPFVNINITNHNVNENVETTSQDVYQINEDTEYRSYVRIIENETGTLYISKYGDIFVPKETNEIETIYNIKEDIETKAVQP